MQAGGQWPGWHAVKWGGRQMCMMKLPVRIKIIYNFISSMTCTILLIMLNVHFAGEVCEIVQVLE